MGPLPGQIELPIFDLDAGRAARDAGIDRAARHADSDPSAWSAEAAYAALVQLARTKPYVHVDALAEAYTPTCPRPNAQGAIWLKALREGIIQPTGGSRQSKQPGKHAHRYPVYESRLYRAPSQYQEQRSA